MKGFFTGFKRILNKRSLKYGSNSIILIAVVVAIAVFINMIVGMVPAKWDLTANKLYSIGDVTKEILKGLDRDVTIYGLYDDGKLEDDDSLKQVAELLDQYNSKHVKVEYVDADRDPTVIESIDPDNLESLVKTDFLVKCGNKMKKIKYNDLFEYNQDNYGQQYKSGINAEQFFTGAIKYVISDKTPVVYFTEGHDEKRLDTDFTILKGQLDKNNFDVKTINLMTIDKMPEDCEVLVIAGPKKDLSLAEKEKLKDYLEGGAKVIFMLDSLSNDTKLPMFEDILKDYNITVNYDRVTEVEKNRYNTSKPYEIFPYFQSDGLNANISNVSNFSMLMPSTRSFNILKNKKEYLTTTSLAKTSAKALGKPISGGEDITGPLDVIVSAEYTGTATPTKIIAMGSSAFTTDTVISQSSVYGLHYFVTALNWMQNKTDDLYIAPKEYEQVQLNITQLQANILGGTVTILIPLLILAIGTTVWAKRRHL